MQLCAWILQTENKTYGTIVNLYECRMVVNVHQQWHYYPLNQEDSNVVRISYAKEDQKWCLYAGSPRLPGTPMTIWPCDMNVQGADMDTAMDRELQSWR